jgi:hypothetical protein
MVAQLCRTIHFNKLEPVMTKSKLSVAFLLVLALTTSFTIPAVAKEALPGLGLVGREVLAPPWSFACTNDQGPRECGEPMWVYGSARDISRYRRAF